MSEETIITLSIIAAVVVAVVALIFIIMLIRKQNIRRINLQSGEHQMDISTHSNTTTVTGIRQSGDNHVFDVSGGDKKVEDVNQEGKGNRVNIQ